MCVIIFYFIRTLRAQVQYPRGMGKKNPPLAQPS